MIAEIIMAILQALFEWLPISSSGQVMIFATRFLGIPPEKAFSLAIWLHIGTMFAVLVKFRKEYKNILLSLIPKSNESEIESVKQRNWLIYSTIATACTALPLYFAFQMLISGYLPLHGDIITILIALFLIITGIILLKRGKNKGTKTLNNLSDKNLKKDSVISGLVQGTAILPGISRSGIIVTTLLSSDYEPDSALKLSFLMSVPVVIASIGVEILVGNYVYIDPLTIVITTLISFVVGYISMEFLLKMAKKIEFGYFCLIYGAIAICVIIVFLFM
ncbi:MAG: undecaprenyl-diphosphate phosphatase [Promethearchaeota archaeon]